MGYIAQTPGERNPDSYSEFLQTLQTYVTDPSEENYAALDRSMQKLLDNPQTSTTVKQLIRTVQITLKNSHHYISKHKDKIKDVEKKIKDYKPTPDQQKQLDQAKEAYLKAKARVQEELNKLKSLLSS